MLEDNIQVGDFKISHSQWGKGHTFRAWLDCLRYLTRRDKLLCKSDRWYERTLDSYLTSTCANCSYVLFAVLRNTPSAGSSVPKLHFVPWVVRNGWRPWNHLWKGTDFWPNKGQAELHHWPDRGWSPETLQDPTGNREKPRPKSTAGPRGQCRAHEECVHRL